MMMGKGGRGEEKALGQNGLDIGAWLRSCGCEKGGCGEWGWVGRAYMRS